MRIVKRVIKEDLNSIKDKFYHHSDIKGATWRAVDLTDDEMKTLGKYGWKTMNDGRKHSEVVLSDKEYNEIFKESMHIRESVIDDEIQRWGAELIPEEEYSKYDIEKKEWVENSLKPFLQSLGRGNVDCKYYKTNQGREYIVNGSRIVDVTADSFLGMVEDLVTQRGIYG